MATPRKCPGRLAPHRISEMSGTSTTVWCSTPPGYISLTLGKNTASTPASISLALSSSMVRGYASKSSLAPNCIGLTKILTTTRELCALARLTSFKCPLCRFPMVGTNPTVLPLNFHSVVSFRNDAMSSTTFIFKPRYSKLCSGDGKAPLCTSAIYC